MKKSQITDDVLIDAKKNGMMKMRILREERKNEKEKNKNTAQMVQRIKDIIEEEVDTNAD